MVEAPSKLIEAENLPADKTHYYYSLLSSKNLHPSYLLNEICSKLTKEKIQIQENGNFSSVTIENKFNFIIQKIDSFLNLLICSNLSNISIKRSLEQNISKIKWLSYGWLSPDDINYFKGYSDDDDIINLYTRYDPYYLHKRLSKITSELQDKYQTRWYKPRGIEVNIKAPKIDAQVFLSEILKKPIVTEAVKLKFIAKFTNPGDANIIVDQDAKVIHWHGKLQVADKIVIDVVNKTQEKISTYREYSTIREYIELQDGSFDLADFSLAQPFYYDFEPRAIMGMDEFSIKLENLLTMSNKNLQIYGVRLRRKGRNFSCLTYIPVDKSEIRMNFIADKGNPKLIVEPVNITPVGILTLTRTLTEKMSWTTKLRGFYE